MGIQNNGSKRLIQWEYMGKPPLMYISDPRQLGLNTKWIPKFAAHVPDSTEWDLYFSSKFFVPISCTPLESW